MRLLRRTWEAAASYTLLLAAGVGALLIGVGFRADTLPFLPGAAFSDAVISHWPAALYLKESVGAGYFPLWRSLMMNGAPFAANPLNKVWYPFQWAVLLLPPALHLNILVWLHLTVGGIGMRALARRSGLGVDAAGILGIAWALTPRLIGAIGAGHLDIVYAIGWFPWVLWATIQVAAAPNRRRIALLGFLAALAFLADMRLSVFIFMTAGGLALISLPAESRAAIRSVAALAASVLIGLGLAAVQWLPLITLAPSLSRAGLTVAEAGVYSLDPLALIGMVWPRLLLNQEWITTVGITVLGLAILGSLYALRRERKALFWLAAAGIASLYALGTNGLLWPVLVKLLPALLWMRVPARAWIVVNLAVLILAGMALERLGSRPLVAVVGLLIIGELLYNDTGLLEARPQSQWLDAYAPLARALDEAGVSRFYSPSYSVPQQVTASWHIANFGGVDPFQLKDFIPPFAAASGVHVDGYSVMLPEPDVEDPTRANQHATVDARALGRWGVSHVIASFPIANPDLEFVQQVNSLYLYRNSDYHYPQITWRGPNCFQADFPPAATDNDQPETAALWPQVPGWQVEGTTIGQGIIIMRAGTTVEGCYQPPDLGPSAAITAVSLLITLVLMQRPRHA